MRLDVSAGFARGDRQEPVSINPKFNQNLRRAGDHRRYTLQLKTCKGPAVIHQLPFALDHVDQHGGLPVLIGGEFLGTTDGYGCVSTDDLFGQPAHGFQPQRQRQHIQQQHFVVRFVTDQDIGLDRGANGNHLIRVNFVQGVLDLEELSDSLLNPGYPG